MAPNATAISSLAVTSHTVSFDHDYGAWILTVMGAGRKWTLKCDDATAANLWSDAIGESIKDNASTASAPASTASAPSRAPTNPSRAAAFNGSTRENLVASPTESSTSTEDTFPLSPRQHLQPTARAPNAQPNSAALSSEKPLVPVAGALRRAPTGGGGGLFSSSNGRLQTVPTDTHAPSIPTTPTSANGRLQLWMTSAPRSPPAPVDAYADAYASANRRLQHWPSSDSVSSARDDGTEPPPLARRENRSNAGTSENQTPGGGGGALLTRTLSLRSRERPPRIGAGPDMLRTGSNRSAHSLFTGPDIDQSLNLQQQDTRARR
ncbi:hypothetical protein HDU84_004158 [Entophlyctis sp. JEL0112]|nr:hypothetical protein HDU84_004158 [Entophlyctis sp. JEL0112]